MAPHRFPGSMTAKQFAKVVKRSKARSKINARARRVLVDGENIRDVAKSEGVTFRAVYKVIYEVCTPPPRRG